MKKTTKAKTKTAVKVKDLKPKKDAKAGVTTASGGAWKTTDGGTTWKP